MFISGNLTHEQVYSKDTRNDTGCRISLSALTPPQQIPLAIQLKDEFDFRSFYFAELNNELEIFLKRWMTKEGEPFIYIWSSETVGKTHLLQAISQDLSEKKYQVCYIPMLEFVNYLVEALEGLEEFDFICVDDIQILKGNEKWQQAIFHLFNRLMSSGSRLVITGDKPPSELKLNLADLKTRLASGLMYPFKDLSDDEKKAVFKHRAQLRGFDLPEDGADYIFNRIPRNMSTLISFLDRLDKSSLVAKRKLTIPFIKNVLDTEKNNS